jgi:uncharacterized protein (DUF433 family)
MSITSDEGILGGEPRIDGTRIGVRHIANYVIKAGYPPAYVADQLDVAISEVYEALAYYDEHPETMRDIERANEAAHERLREIALEPNDHGS